MAHHLPMTRTTIRRWWAMSRILSRYFLDLTRGSWLAARGSRLAARGSWLVARGSWLRGSWLAARGPWPDDSLLTTAVSRFRDSTSFGSFGQPISDAPDAWLRKSGSGREMNRGRIPAPLSAAGLRTRRASCRPGRAPAFASFGLRSPRRVRAWHAPCLACRRAVRLNNPRACGARTLHTDRDSAAHHVGRGAPRLLPVLPKERVCHSEARLRAEESRCDAAGTARFFASLRMTASSLPYL